MTVESKSKSWLAQQFTEFIVSLGMSLLLPLPFMLCLACTFYLSMGWSSLRWVVLVYLVLAATTAACISLCAPAED